MLHSVIQINHLYKEDMKYLVCEDMKADVKCSEHNLHKLVNLQRSEKQSGLYVCTFLLLPSMILSAAPEITDLRRLVSFKRLIKL